MRRHRPTLALAALLLAGPAAAQDYTDPTWPCIQRKVPELTVAQMWAGPVPEEAETSPGIERLAERIAQRRVPVEEAATAAAELVEGLEGDARARQLAALFGAVLKHLNAERDAIISGIGRYARRQADLADRVEQEQLELAALERAPDADKDMDRVEELQDTLAWDTRIFRERAQALTFVCETPTLIERRAFELARAFAALI